MQGEDMNIFIDVAHEFSCALYDPQVGKRYEVQPSACTARGGSFAFPSGGSASIITRIPSKKIMRRLLFLLVGAAMLQITLAKTHDVGYGTFEAHEDFTFKRTGTADSYMGTLTRKSDGFTITFDVGWMAGIQMSDRKRAQCEFYRRHNVGGVAASTGIERVDDRRRIVTTIDFDSNVRRVPANFWADVRTEAEVAEFLLIVTTYKPKEQ